MRALTWLVVASITAIGVWLGVASGVYGLEYVKRVLVWQETDQHDYTFNFPQSVIRASDQPMPFGSEPSLSVLSDLADAFGVEDFESVLDQTKTEALIIIEDDRVVLEDYRLGTTRDTLLTSFSVAKAFVAVLVGVAIDEGVISEPDVPITNYLPELAERDPRFEAITIRNLLTMSSGLDFQAFRWALFNGDDPLTSYFPDQRSLALTAVNYLRPPGEVFSYNKYHPQLLGLILERVTGMTITEYTQSRLWEPLGMEFDGSWSLDSRSSGFEKMEAGLNARAIDFAKFGRLFVNDGKIGGKEVVSSDWLSQATRLPPDQHRPEYYGDDWGKTVYSDGHGYYGFFVYGRIRDNARPDVFAEGDRGQYIYVSPSANLIIVRLGKEYGMRSADWIDGFYAYASASQ